MDIYACVYNLHPEPIFVIDPQGVIQAANPGCRALIGYSEAEIRQMNWLSVFRLQELEKVRQHFQLALRGEQQIFDTVIQHRAGHWIDLQINHLPIVQNGRVVGVIGLAKDITARKQEQERLQHAEKMYRLISEHVQDLISISTPEGITTYVSPAVRTLLGYQPEEVIGKSTFVFWHPEDVQQLMQRTLGDMDVFECRVKHKAGHWVWFETRYQKIRDEHGAEMFVIGVGRDITQRKQFEEQLRRSESSLAHAQRVAQIGHWEWDVVDDDYFWSCEMYRIYGFEPGEVGVNYQVVMSFVHPDDRELFDMAVQESLQRGLPFEPEYRIIRPDGEIRYIQAQGDMVYDENGRIVRLFGVVQDITERKRTEELFLQSEKLTLAGQLAAGIAHEIRNPLTALKGFLQMMMQNKRENEEHLNVMYSELNRIEMILSELLVLAKPQAKNFDRHDAALLLFEVLTLLNTQAILNNIELVSEIEHDLPFISCNSNELKQVFINFLKNSIEAMPGGGKITVRAVRQGEQAVLISFIDEGCGIPQARLARLGEPFYTTKEKGTGLGFMVSKKIIEHHQGSVRVTSKVDVGTTIDVVLPASAR